MKYLFLKVTKSKTEGQPDDVSLVAIEDHVVEETALKSAEEKVVAGDADQILVAKLTATVSLEMKRSAEINRATATANLENLCQGATNAESMDSSDPTKDSMNDHKSTTAGHAVH